MRDIYHFTTTSADSQTSAFICHCQILGQHKNVEFLFKKSDLFSNHHKLVLKRSFQLFFDVLRSWDDVFSDFFGFVLCWRGSFGLVPQRFLSSSDMYDCLRIPSENITISGSVSGSRFGYYITLIPPNYFHRPSHHKWTSHPKLNPIDHARLSVGKNNLSLVGTTGYSNTEP